MRKDVELEQVAPFGGTNKLGRDKRKRPTVVSFLFIYMRMKWQLFWIDVSDTLHEFWDIIKG